MTEAHGATWAQVWDQLQLLIWQIAGGLGSQLSPLNLGASLLLCLILWLVWKPRQGFLGWVFPARIYRSASFWLDLRLWLLNWFIGLFVFVHYAAIATITAYAVGSLLGLTPPGPADRHPVLSAIVIFLAADLALYAYHRLNHEKPLLWAFHALHHSAEEMSPITAFRHHPLYHITAGLIVAGFVGLVQGLAMALVIGQLDVALLAGTNVAVALLNLATNNLKHSHIRLRYPGWLEHILISPAQHQVHHSIHPHHHNRNYGDILALWDWLFGTLYVTRPEEDIRFGLGNTRGEPLPQRHPTLARALVEPMGRARAILRQRRQ